MTTQEPDLMRRIASIAQDSQISPDDRLQQILKLTNDHSTTGTDGVKNQQQTDGDTAPGSDLTPAQKLSLITSNLQETLNPEIIEDVLNKQSRAPVIYWGTATTGRPHCGYLVPMLQIATFLRAGCRMKILLADIHGFLDNLKAPIELVKHRATYYQHVITALLRAVGVSVSRLEFVLGSSYQLSQAYVMDLLRLSTEISEHDAKKAGAEVVKQVENAKLSGLIYPLMQTLDEQYLGVDVQFGGADQRKIFALAKDGLPRIGYKERAHLMNPMIPGLTGGKMSASDPDSKIDVLDPPELVTKKLKKSFAAPKEVEGNGILSFVEYVLLPASALKEGGTPRFVVEQRDAEPLVYSDIEKIHADYKADILSPQTLKPAVTAALNTLLASVQAEFQASPEWQEVEKMAYPPPPLSAEELKKQQKKDAKKNKDKGSKRPAVGEVRTQPDGSVAAPTEEKQRQVDVAGSAEEAMKDLKVDRDKK
ncbi:MAG: hypothetical protein M1831_006360 [Alyxoria varia]|nr:MAG: hypothetical protein M1831_006360 [Alyxoria varia]